MTSGRALTFDRIELHMTFSLMVDGSSTQVLGLSIFGPKPITRAHIRFDDDLIALYGKNGVGKTRALGAIGDALSGIACDGQIGMVHLHVVAPAEVSPSGWVGQVVTSAVGLLRGRMEKVQHRHEADGMTWREIERQLRDFPAVDDDARDAPSIDLKSVVYRSLIFDKHYVTYAAVDERLATEIADGGYLVAIAAGDRHAPSWRVCAAIAPPMPSFTRFVNDKVYDADVAGRRRMNRLVGEMVAAAKRGDDTTELESRFREDAPTVPDPDDFIRWDWPGCDPTELAMGVDADTVWESDWAPVPLVQLATVTMMPVHAESVDVDEGLLSRRTIDVIFHDSRPGEIEAVADMRSLELSDAFKERVSMLESQATATFTDLLYGQPVPPAHDSLRFQMRSLRELLRGKPPRWGLLPAGVTDTQLVPLQELSKAQRRWAAHAINLSLKAPGEGVVSLIDEPEEGLHRSVESKLPIALRKVSGAAGVIAICATHSPDMLAKSSLYHLDRAGSRTCVTPKALNLAQAGRYLDGIVDELGLRPADILQLVKCFILVEGAHDVIVLESLLGAELEAAGVRVLPMRGAKSAGTAIGTDLLLNYTSANIVLVMDNISADAIQPIWNDVKSLVANADRKGAHRRLNDLEKLSGWEASWMREALEVAIDNGIVDRVTPMPLNEPDVICYLPAEKFVPGTTWADIVREWRRGSAQDRGNVDLKTWMRDRFRVEISKKTLRAAAEGAAVHGDIRDIGAAAGAIVNIPEHL